MAGDSSNVHTNPTSEELLTYFLAVAGFDHLGPVLALLEPDEILEMRRISLLKLAPSRVSAIRTATLRRVGAITKSLPPVDDSPALRDWFA